MKLFYLKKPHCDLYLKDVEPRKHNEPLGYRPIWSHRLYAKLFGTKREAEIYARAWAIDEDVCVKADGIVS